MSQDSSSGLSDDYPLRFVEIEGASLKLPLLGDKIYEFLAKIEKAFNDKKAGQIFYIEGEGGTGKSQLLNQVRRYFDELPPSDPSQVKLLFGDIIDLYDYTAYVGRGIERALISNWHERYKQNAIDFVFKKYNKAQVQYDKFPVALPNIFDLPQMIDKRRKELDKLFLQGLKALTEPTHKYLPVICLDTAELLGQEDFEDPDSISHSDAVKWLARLLKSDVARQCIFLIAGRKFRDPAKTMLVELSVDKKKLSFREFLEECSQTRQLTIENTFEPQLLDEGWIKTYLYCYLREGYNTEFTTINVLKAEAEEKWSEIARDLQELRSLPKLRLTKEDAIWGIRQMTEGKPLLVDWFCYIAQQNQLPGDPMGLGEILDRCYIEGKFEEAGLRSDFKRKLGEIIGKGNPQIFSLDDFKPTNGVIPTDTAITKVLQIACVARKGLDPATILLLADNRISLEMATSCLEYLKQHAFIKVRKSESKSKFGPGELLFLHDEIYESLLGEISGLLDLSKIARQLAEAYTGNATFKRSVMRLRKKINYLTSSKLIASSTDATSALGVRNWYEDKDKVEEHIEIERQIRSRMVERLYYRFQAKLQEGYDEYCIVAALAIVEQEISLDTRLKKELLRYLSRQQPLELLFHYHYRWEGEIRKLKRRYRDNPEIKKQEVLDRLRKLSEDEEQPLKLPSLSEDQKQLQQWLDQVSDLRRAYLSCESDDDAGRQKLIEQLKSLKKEVDTSNERQMARVWRRVVLCKADTLVSIYEYQSPDGEKPRLDLNWAIALAEAVTVETIMYKLGEVRNYLYWQKNVVLGRAYHALGQNARKVYMLPKAIRYYRLAIEHYKNAENRIEIYINDSRNNLAYVYNLFGQQTLALETVTEALESLKLYGHKIYIAISQNIQARILLSSNRTMAEAYNISQGALALIREGFDREEEFSQLTAYHVILATNGEIARRVGRYYADSPDQTAHLHNQAIKHLKQACLFFKSRGSENESQMIEAQNELGCAYRSWGRVLEYQLEKLLGSDNLDKKQQKVLRLEKKRDKAIEKAGKNLKEVEDYCKTRPALWFQRLDNLQDIAQLASYQQCYNQQLEVSEVEDAFNFAQRILTQYKDSSHSGEKLHYHLFSSRLNSRWADWDWKRYQQDKLLNKPDSEKWISQYTGHQIKALQHYAGFHFVLSLIDDSTIDYSRESLYLNKISADVNKNLRENNERQIAIRELKTGLVDLRERLRIGSGKRKTRRPFIIQNRYSKLRSIKTEPSLITPSNEGYYDLQGLLIFQFILNVTVSFNPFSGLETIMELDI